MKYLIGGTYIEADDRGFESALGRAHANKVRPLCCCRDPGIEMYVAKMAGKFIIKRMPNSGSVHSPTCESYEPPAELSGLGEVMGTAIQEDLEAGTTALKLNFSLTKMPGRSPPQASGEEKDSVKTDGNKLSLRGTLHYLWEQAGFNRWAPSMAGKRSWYVIRKFLLQAAEDKTTKGNSLSEVLYIPESFNLERKGEINARRVAQFAKASASGGAKKLMICIGEIKEISPSRYGHKIVFKHLSDCHFMMNDDLHKRLVKRFEREISLWDGLESSHLIAIGTFSISSAGVPSLEECALMCVTENWIPFENMFDHLLIETMCSNNRRFMKGLRYNLPSTRPLASLVASDTPDPTAMYISPPDVTEEYTSALNNLIDDSKMPHWLWHSTESMPSLPAIK